MCLLICQTYLISTIFEPGDYSRERRNFQTSVPPSSFLMTQKVPRPARRMLREHATLLQGTATLFYHLIRGSLGCNLF
jgi:hypothetical protein